MDNNKQRDVPCQMFLADGYLTHKQRDFLFGF